MSNKTLIGEIEGERHTLCSIFHDILHLIFIVPSIGRSGNRPHKRSDYTLHSTSGNNIFGSNFLSFLFLTLFRLIELIDTGISLAPRLGTKFTVEFPRNVTTVCIDMFPYRLCSMSRTGGGGGVRRRHVTIDHKRTQMAAPIR
jgi:hypothetical protein